MIVRISGEGQFDLPDEGAEALGDLERAVGEAVEEKNEADYRQAFAALLEYVRGNGRPLREDELETSNVILPPPDTTLDEASQEFSGEGLIPD